MNGTFNTISFPGFGIGPFNVNPVAFKFFGHPVAWYGILIALGILLAIVYAMWRARHEGGIIPDDILDVAIFAVPAAIIGARLYYVIFYGNYTSFYDVIAVWNGGLAVYGGIIGGVIAAVFVCMYKKKSFLLVADVCAPAIMIGQILGRWGNFTNGEAYGGATTLPWRMGVSHTINGVAVDSTQYVHPTFLYESLWNLLGFVLINLMYRHKKFNGQIFLTYVAWYGFGRMFIEGLRTDSLYLGPIRISQLLGLLTFIVAMIFILIGFSNMGRSFFKPASYSVAPIAQPVSEAKAAVSTVEKKDINTENFDNIDTSKYDNIDVKPEDAKPAEAETAEGKTEKQEEKTDSSDQELLM